MPAEMNNNSARSFLWIGKKTSEHSILTRFLFYARYFGMVALVKLQKR